MTRLIKENRAKPYILKREDLGDDQIWICGCGLSATKPFCDDSHLRLRSEPADRLLYYPGNDDEATAIPVDPRALEPAPEAEDSTPEANSS